MFTIRQRVWVDSFFESYQSQHRVIGEVSHFLAAHLGTLSQFIPWGVDNFTLQWILQFMQCGRSIQCEDEWCRHYIQILELLRGTCALRPWLWLPRTWQYIVRSWDLVCHLLSNKRWTRRNSVNHTRTPSWLETKLEHELFVIYFGWSPVKIMVAQLPKARSDLKRGTAENLRSARKPCSKRHQPLHLLWIIGTDR